MLVMGVWGFAINHDRLSCLGQPPSAALCSCRFVLLPCATLRNFVQTVGPELCKSLCNFLQSRLTASVEDSGSWRNAN